MVETAGEHERPLEGIIVADFSRVLAGPLATMMLADLGATVIKVERPGVGDDTRHWGPPWTSTSSSYFEGVNRSKSSVALDLNDVDDRRRARELARRADVFIHNFRSGALERHGLGYRDVARSNPAVVYCSISGFGSDGGADIPGYDFVVQAVGGLMSVTGDVGGDPMKVGVALVDVLTGKDAVIGVLAALRGRDLSGVGEHVEVNLLSSLLSGMVNQAMSYLATGVAPGRMGNQHPSIAPYETLRCSDRHVAVACGNDAQFRKMAAALGVPGLADDPRFRRNEDRVAHRDEMVLALEARLMSETAATWESRLTEAGVPAGVVGDLGSAFRRAAELGLAPRWVMPDGHPDQVAHPISYSRTRLRPPYPPPLVGEQTETIARWLDEALDRPAPTLETDLPEEMPR
ncbi:CaiB/BaiF CoA-transferase family protein [Aeromicrobium sp. 9AM]|uniref:CaiB/BaiF CoA transferase family protein n=1 Tax=Aeromicrobium sp. 9AM TaxID=2653126 RepID=UPI0012EFDE39|nr:CoA transferase [Aeromicrobium sp. 9AM]VXB73758.1 Formyl-CoA transferase [Aeromicrobium sp. 9AM]